MAKGASKAGNGKRATGLPPKTAGQPKRWPADRVVRLRTEDLVPYARNARLHTNDQIDQLAGSIKRFGFTNAVIVAANGEIIAGHGRVMAARRLNLDEVPCVVIADGEWTEDDRRAYRIWDNQSALLSEWSPEMLRIELSYLKLEGYDLQLTGFDDASLVTYLAGVSANPPDQFPAVGDDIATEYCCPRCAFRWSGKPDAGAMEDQPDKRISAK